eukprot:1160374-Pelagomonas_calceolata.AAC.9
MIFAQAGCSCTTSTSDVSNAGGCWCVCVFVFSSTGRAQGWSSVAEVLCIQEEQMKRGVQDGFADFTYPACASISPLHAMHAHYAKREGG